MRLHWIKRIYLDRLRFLRNYKFHCDFSENPSQFVNENSAKMRSMKLISRWADAIPALAQPLNPVLAFDGFTAWSRWWDRWDLVAGATPYYRGEKGWKCFFYCHSYYISSISIKLGLPSSDRITKVQAQPSLRWFQIWKIKFDFLLD